MNDVDIAPSHATAWRRWLLAAIVALVLLGGAVTLTSGGHAGASCPGVVATGALHGAGAAPRSITCTTGYGYGQSVGYGY